MIIYCKKSDPIPSILWYSQLVSDFACTRIKFGLSYHGITHHILQVIVVLHVTFKLPWHILQPHSERYLGREWKKKENESYK